MSKAFFSHTSTSRIPHYNVVPLPLHAMGDGHCGSFPSGRGSKEVLNSGCCGAHVGTRILANKALRAGYFWPTMRQDAIPLVSKCERCQKHSSLIHQQAESLTTMLSPCPFMQWGMDIVGPFPLAAGQSKFLLVAIDYFTK
ncbi:UNVERIFIED_CONTAM: hypothetical protein Sradi_5727200 [Sesamum radiatum]|uniref:Integrase zinc-binding domain-containing protein n=1 Tax=Sesamum radiatum TaxID=300843 RepID=A0AAW2L315_SESRA